MPVDKFGRNCDRTTTVYTGINIANLTNSFLRRDGDNTAIGAIDMNSNIIKNVADPFSNNDVATNNYVDTNAFTTAGGVVSGDIKLNVDSILVKSLRCNDLSAGKKFTLLLGTDTKMLTYSVPNSGLSVPIKVRSDVGFAILIDELPICVFGRDGILCSRPRDMDQHSIKNVKNPADRLDAVNKAYADRLKYGTDTGNISNTVMTDHILFTFPATKSFASGKIKIYEMWVERLSDEWITTLTPMFSTDWPSFHKFSRCSFLMTFFTGSPASGWTRNFRLDYVDLP